MAPEFNANHFSFLVIYKVMGHMTTNDILDLRNVITNCKDINATWILLKIKRGHEKKQCQTS